MRWAVSFLGLAILAGIVVALADAYGPARVSEVTGSVVTREVLATNASRPVSYVYVRVDGGRTVRACAEGDVTAMPGDRVVLVQTESALLGLRRYRYERHVGAWARD